MGLIYVKVQLAGTSREEEVQALVDTGATYSVLPPALAQRLGVMPFPRPLRVRLANGDEVEAQVGAMLVRWQEREAAAIVVILPGAEPLLGAEALEGLGVKVDPTTGALEPTRSYTLRA